MALQGGGHLRADGGHLGELLLVLIQLWVGGHEAVHVRERGGDAGQLGVGEVADIVELGRLTQELIMVWRLGGGREETIGENCFRKTETAAAVLIKAAV